MENAESLTIVNENTKVAKKRNFTFDLLYALAIIMVVDDHTGNQIGILSKIFPYDSFFMPLFVFISGYFFKKVKICENVKHKIKKLLIPAIIWNIVIAGIALLIDNIFKTHWSYDLTIKKFIISLLNDTLTLLNGPAWFVIMLFWISIGYNACRNIFKLKKNNDIILTLIFILIGFISVYLCCKGYYRKGWKIVTILKFTFYIQFYHLGYMFKLYGEARIRKVNKYFLCGLCTFINIILVLIYGKNVNFFSTSIMNGFSYWYLPLISSTTGIIFWYTIMNYFADKIKTNRYITFIAKNTFTIMETHLLFANLVNLLFYVLKNKGMPYFVNFDSIAFCASPWSGAAWKMNPFFGVLGFLFGIILSIIVAIIIDKIKEYNKIFIKENKKITM